MHTQNMFSTSQWHKQERMQFIAPSKIYQKINKTF